MFKLTTIAIALAMASRLTGTEAFVPALAQQPRQLQPNHQYQPPHSHQPPELRSRWTTGQLPSPFTVPMSTTALSMNMLTRFYQVAKSNINNLLRYLEDPEKIMNQAVEDMQSDLVRIRQSYAEITATQRRMLKQKEQTDTMANEWYHRAQLALKRGNEGLAREALARRQVQLDEAAQLQEQLQQQQDSMDKLYEGMQMLERKILESKAKKEQLAARARTAQSTQRVNDMLGGITGRTSLDAFSRMEEKVESLEAKAEVSAESGTMYGTVLPGSSESAVESQFRALESYSNVDDELAKLKGIVANSYSGSASTTSNSMEDELEKLKLEAGIPNVGRQIAELKG